MAKVGFFAERQRSRRGQEARRPAWPGHEKLRCALIRSAGRARPADSSAIPQLGHSICSRSPVLFLSTSNRMLMLGWYGWRVSDRRSHVYSRVNSPGRVSNLSLMPLQGEYEPSPAQWVRDQVETYESSGGTKANTLLDTGLPVVIVTTRGVRSGKLRKTPLMRVEHGGEYALVGSQGGAPTHPKWVHNLRRDPEAVTIQDGPEPHDYSVREIEGDERQVWWDRSVAAFPPYAEYEKKTERHIPVFLATPRG